MDVVHHRRLPVGDARRHLVFALVDLRAVDFVRGLARVQDRVLVGEQLNEEEPSGAEHAGSVTHISSRVGEVFLQFAFQIEFDGGPAQIDDRIVEDRLPFAQLAEVSTHRLVEVRDHFGQVSLECLNGVLVNDERQTSSRPSDEQLTSN